VKLDDCSTSTSGAMTWVPLVAAAKSRIRASGAASRMEIASSFPSVTDAPGAILNDPPKFRAFATMSMR
jgi:hypothetical protein